MYNLIKADIYIVLYKKIRIMILIMSVIMCVIIAVMKAGQETGFELSDVCSGGIENFILPSIIAIPTIIYYFFYDYFENDFYSYEVMLRYSTRQIVCAKLCSVIMLTGTVYAIIPTIILAISEVINHNILYDALLLRCLVLFLIVVRLCIDSVMLLYVIQNFFVYIIAVSTIWMIISEIIKNYRIEKIRLYNLSWRYQMSLVASTGVTGKMLVKYAIPYELICIIVHILFMSSMIYLDMKKKR